MVSPDVEFDVPHDKSLFPEKIAYFLKKKDAKVFAEEKGVIAQYFETPLMIDAVLYRACVQYKC